MVHENIPDPMFDRTQWRMYASQLGAYIECWYEEQYKPKPNDLYYKYTTMAMLNMAFAFRNPRTVARHVFYGRDDPFKHRYLNWLNSEYVIYSTFGSPQFLVFRKELQRLCDEQIRILYP